MTSSVSPPLCALRWERDGAQLFPHVLDEPALKRLEEALSDVPSQVPGVRLKTAPRLLPFLDAEGPIGTVAAGALGPRAHPVRAILFDKTPERNWALGWHQDRTIVVKERIEVEGFGPWTVKAGLIQVEPPFELLERMVTLRVHLDPVDATNAPLRIAPGSHRCGRVPESEISARVAALGERLCLAGRGDVWLYSTPIIHGSHAATPPRRRRVLQVDYSPDASPGPLSWHGL